MQKDELGGWDAMLGRAVRDPEFRERLMTDPDSATREYDLTDDQIADLKEVNADAARKFFDSVSSAEDRLGIKQKKSKADWCTDKKCNDR